MSRLLSKHNSRTLYMISAAVVIFLIAVHIILPVWLTGFVRRQIQAVDSYRISFSEVSISLSRASYTIHNAQVFEVNGSTSPLFVAREIELSLSGWENSLLVGRATVRSPRLVFIDSIESAEFANEPLKYPLRSIASNFMAVPLNEILVTDGHLYFLDLNSSPRLRFEMRDINIHVGNLVGATENGDELVARANGRSTVYGGKLRFSVNFNPDSPEPEFNMRARLESLDLSYISDYLDVYGQQSLGKGLFSMLAEARGEEETITGFVKPLLETTYMVLTPVPNPHRFYAARNPFARPYPQISFHGNMKIAALSLWSAVAFTLRNAFLEALDPVIHKIDAGENKNFRQHRVPSLPEKRRSA